MSDERCEPFMNEPARERENEMMRSVAHRSALDQELTRCRNPRPSPLNLQHGPRRLHFTSFKNVIGRFEQLSTHGFRELR